jgi:hypothetical protein
MPWAPRIISSHLRPVDRRPSPASSEPPAPLEIQERHNGRKNHQADRERIADLPLEFRHHIKVHAVIGATSVGGRNTTAATEKIPMIMSALPTEQMVRTHY